MRLLRTNQKQSADEFLLHIQRWYCFKKRDIIAQKDDIVAQKDDIVAQKDDIAEHPKMILLYKKMNEIKEIGIEFD